MRMIFDITSQIFVNLETEGPTAEDSWTPPDPNAEGRAFPRAAAWAGRLRLPLSLLRPPSPYFSSLSPPPVAAAAARPRHFRPTGLPSPAHSFTARAGERRGHPQVGAPSRSQRVCVIPAVAAPGSVVG